MSFDPNGCSHGIAWDKTCVDCEQISIKQNIYSLSVDCKRVVEALERLPIMATSPEVIIDLYRTIDRLAMLLLRIK